jgi:hypothetical protein
MFLEARKSQRNSLDRIQIISKVAGYDRTPIGLENQSVELELLFRGLRMSH